MKTKLSFILPSYNVAPYIEKCIRSIRDCQMPSDEFEIIVINDGSPDNLRDIVISLKNELRNIVLIDQLNAGVSKARNKGILEAKGEYLIFIDPDDFVEPNHLLHLYNYAKTKNLDILLSGRSQVVGETKTIKFDYNRLENQILSGEDAYYEKDIPFSVWDSSVGRLYKRQMIIDNEIFYPENVPYLEDGVFVRKSFCVANKCGFLDIDFYQVFSRENSTTKSTIPFSKDAFLGFFICVENLAEFKKNRKLNSRQLGIINSSVIKYALLPLMQLSRKPDFNRFKEILNYYNKNSLKRLDINGVENSIYLRYAKLFNINPKPINIYMFFCVYTMEMFIKSLKSRIMNRKAKLIF